MLLCHPNPLLFAIEGCPSYEECFLWHIACKPLFHLLMAMALFLFSWWGGSGLVRICVPSHCADWSDNGESIRRPPAVKALQQREDR